MGEPACAEQIKRRKRAEIDATTRSETKMDKQALDQKARLSLLEAAQLISSDPSSTHAIETDLAHAIEHGRLHASVKRWATEQWEGKQLPGNINRRETFIDRNDLDAWRKTSAGA